MRSKTYRVPGIDENAVHLTGLSLIVRALVNRMAWSGATTVAEAQAAHDDFASFVLDNTKVMDLTSDAPAENKRIRATLLRFVADTLDDARPVA